MPEIKARELCEHFACRELGTIGDPDFVFVGIKPLHDASEKDISFCTNEKYLNDAYQSKAGAIICSEAIGQQLVGKIKGRIFCSPEAYVLVARIGQYFFKPRHPFQGVSSQSYIDESAVLGKDVVIFPFVFIGPGAKIGDRTVLYPGVFVGAGASLGTDCIVYPNVVIQEGSMIGNRCILNPGAVLGGDGFGFAPCGMENIKIPQVGAVWLDDDVEIGANASIDRATFGYTRIGAQTKIDSLVQVAHNVEIGRACFLAGQVGVAGSTKIGDRVTLAGQVGVVGHIRLANNITVLAQSGVSKSLLKENEVYAGTPAEPVSDYNFRQAFLRKWVRDQMARNRVHKGKNEGDIHDRKSE